MSFYCNEHIGPTNSCDECFDEAIRIIRDILLRSDGSHAFLKAKAWLDQHNNDDILDSWDY
jgi:hypothetical protein